ncbi:hypothetical protein BGW38_005781 [Lunasporangiospora selenospora]|uniref:Uncharacterized protein n=1 Tax=Lunasporangiospora selenospora TaxID=979761 RepID=A0A9P6FML0_9FUNG|nr:hypothetical protein BGW38_005781 [Lunasporangiospora selenospora]
MSESRAELLAWVNELLQLNVTKVEHLGTGAAYCQIIDSIYGDVPMNRVKFTAKMDYEYLGNFKVLQSYFAIKKIDKPIPTDRLMKCRMQDNLEFLQWIKKYWDGHYNGEIYDSIGRRGPNNDPFAAANRSTSSPARRVTNNGSSAGRLAAGNTSFRGNTSLRGPSPDQSSIIILGLQKELQEERTTVAALEKERDFYFGKLRDIEVMIQQELDTAPESAENTLLKNITNILYSTEEGFEVPEEELGQHGAADDLPDETF